MLLNIHQKMIYLIVMEIFWNILVLILKVTRTNPDFICPDFFQHHPSGLILFYFFFFYNLINKQNSLRLLSNKMNMTPKQRTKVTKTLPSMLWLDTDFATAMKIICKLSSIFFSILISRKPPSCSNNSKNSVCPYLCFSLPSQN